MELKNFNMRLIIFDIRRQFLFYFKHFIYDTEESPDSCYTQSYEPSIENVYIEGLGGPYYSGMVLAPTPSWKMRKLVYYKKGQMNGELLCKSSRE